MVFAFWNDAGVFELIDEEIVLLKSVAFGRKLMTIFAKYDCYSIKHFSNLMLFKHVYRWNIFI